jgi:hypothetical protein
LVLYGCETWSLTIKEEHRLRNKVLRRILRLRVFENRVLRRIFVPKRDEVTGGGDNCIARSFVICTLRQV